MPLIYPNRHNQMSYAVPLLDGNRFSPYKLGSKLLMWLDPGDPSTMDLSYSALFGPTGAYLSVSDHSDFDFSSSQQFSVEFWKNRVNDLSGLNGLDDGFIGQWVHGTSASWAVVSGGSTGQATRVRLFLSINGTGTSAVSILSTSSIVDWSHCVVTFDGTQGTATDRVKIYLDGVEASSYTYSDGDGSSIPSTVQNASSILTIGRGVSVHGLADAAMNRVRLWGGRVLSGADVTALYNSGDGYFHAGLSTGLKTSLVGSWDCTEASGNSRADSSGLGHTMAETGGTVSQVGVVIELIDKATELPFYPVTAGMSPPFSNIGFGGAARLNLTGIGGQPALDFSTYAGMRAAASQAFNVGNFDIVEAFRISAFASSETFFTVSADEATAEIYWFTGEETISASHYMWMRWRNTISDTYNTSTYSDQALSLATNYVNNWRVLGTGDTASHEHRLNGTASSLTYANSAAYNKSLDDPPGRDNVTLGCLCRSDGDSPQIGKRYLMGQVILAGPGILTSQNRQLEQYVARRHSIALAA